MKSSERQLKTWRQWLYAGGNFGVTFSPTVVAAWLGYFYTGRENPDGTPHLLVGAGLFGLIWFACNAINGITDPVVGYLSDRTRSRFGRRKPWVAVGAPLLALSFFFLWMPPDPSGPSTANAVNLTVALFFFWFFFTVVVAPYLSLLPDITPFDGERVRISAFMGIFEVLGTVGGNLLPPLLAALLVTGLGPFGNGYQVMAFTGGLLLILFFFISILSVRERHADQAGAPAGPHKSAVKNALSEFASTFRLPAFRPYVFGVGFYRMAIATTVFIAPFISTKILGAGIPTEAEVAFLNLLGAVNEAGLINWELAAGYLMMVVLMGAALFFPLVSYLVKRWGKQRLFVLALVCFGLITIGMAFIGLLPQPAPLFQALALFGLAAFPVAIAMVVIRPILADVIDADEEMTGRRREGVYNGMEGLIMKVATGLGPLTAGWLFAAFGASTTENLGVRLCGPVAGCCLLVAAGAFMRYPIKK